MARYEVRTNVEYVLEVEAESEEDALRQAESIPVEDWDSASAPYKAEEIED